MSSPQVSVVVPTFNGARFLGEAIDSALAQDGVALEVLVVDDGSTDDTPAVLARYDDRVRVLRQENRGPAVARNRAFAVARAPYVAFLDADDRFLPDKLARQVAVLDSRPDVDLVYTGWWFIDGAGRRLPQHGWSRQDGDVRAQLLLGNLIHPVAAMVRRAAVLAIGGMDATLPVNEDWELFLRLSFAGARWACIDEPLCEYRVHAGQSHGRLTLVHETRLRILERVFAAPTLPAELRAFHGRAVQQACLLAAAELYEAGRHAEGDRIFHDAVRVRPAVLTEGRSMRAFARLLVPLGYQSQAEAARRWRQVTSTVWGAVDRLVRRPDVEPEIGRLAWAARWTVVRTGVRLAIKSARGEKLT